MICRLRTIDDLAKAMLKKLTQGMTEQNKAMSAAKTDEEKNIIVCFPHLFIFLPDLKWTLVLAIFSLYICFIYFSVVYMQKKQKLNSTIGLRTCNNILAMIQVNVFPYAFLVSYSKNA